MSKTRETSTVNVKGSLSTGFGGEGDRLMAVVRERLKGVGDAV